MAWLEKVWYRYDVAKPGLIELGLARLGLTWLGLARLGLAPFGSVWLDLARLGMAGAWAWLTQRTRRVHDLAFMAC